MFLLLPPPSEGGGTAMTDPQLNDADEAIIKHLRDGRNLSANLAALTDYDRHYLSNRLSRLSEHEIVRNTGNGLYELIDDPAESGGETKPVIYTAGAMEWPGDEGDSYWRRSLEADIDNVQFVHPTDAHFDHGGDLISGCVSEDMGFLREADAVVACFSKRLQVGTMTETLHAVANDMPVLCVFTDDLLQGAVDFATRADCPVGKLGPVEMRFEAPHYWFLVNYLAGDEERTNPHKHNNFPNIEKWEGYDNVDVWLSEPDAISWILETWVDNGFSLPTSVVESNMTVEQ